MEHIKAFASRTHDRARPAYGRVREDRPRRGILFATTNNDEYLKEADRRFWPIRTSTIDIEALTRDRDQLWAEAAAHESSTTLGLREALWGDAQIQQEAREETDPWGEILSDVAGTVEQNKERVSTKDLLTTALGIHPSRQSDRDAKRLGRVMRRLGWDGPKMMRIGTDLVRGYERPVRSKER